MDERYLSEDGRARFRGPEGAGPVSYTHL